MARLYRKFVAPTEGEDGDVPALGGEFEDADFRVRAGDLGLDPDRATLLRDIARVTPETEPAVSARIAALTGRGR